MTDQPPPGNYPPPPPPPGGYPTPPQGGGYPPPPQGGPGFAPPPQAPVQVLPKEAYTAWFTRVLAWLIDYIPVAILTAIGVVCLVTMQKVETVCITDESEFELGEFCATGNNGPSTAAWIIFIVCMLAVLAYGIWNYGYRQGTTGSSIGKSMMKFKVVSENTSQPIGFGLSIVRQLAHAIDAAICYVGFLFPLWDSKRQTIADKMIKTVCVPL
jgi:RDD family